MAKSLSNEDLTAQVDELRAFRARVEALFPELRAPAVQRRMGARAGTGEESPGPFDQQPALDRIKR